MREAPEKWLAKVKVKAEAACFVLSVWADHLLRVGGPGPEAYKEPDKVRGSCDFSP